ncbi:MAG TPA: tetratricopeptide repeat protein, partial [Candidatus Saccharimonadia bacterium]|nr:tetratricopeptide repeat protein [Candidatus Saccharimonadia bacterium]
LDRAIEAQQRTHRDTRVGELLVAQGAIGREQLEQQVRLQIEQAVYALFTWSEGTFNFEPDATPEAQDITVAMNPESLLLEGARRVDEWGQIAKKVPSFDIIFEIDHRKLRASGVELEEDQRRVLELIDGQRDVARIIEDAGLGEFEVGKALFGLVTAGFAHRIGTSKGAKRTVPEARVDEHRNLGVAFYKTGMLDESAREFRRVLELRDDDTIARSYLGLILLRRKDWAEAARTLEELTGVSGATAGSFHNLAYAYERLGRHDAAQQALEEAARRGASTDPRVLMSMGVVALRTGRLDAADTALTAARPLWGANVPAPVWFHYAALAAALRGDLPRAAALLDEGVAAHPRSAVLYNDLALVRERRGDTEGAVAAIERGLAEDVKLAQLHKNLGDCLYRDARYDDALESYQRAVKADPLLGDDVYLRMGNIHLRQHERDAAIRCWERALELDPDNAIVRTNLSSVRQPA